MKLCFIVEQPRIDSKIKAIPYSLMSSLEISFERSKREGLPCNSGLVMFARMAW